MILNKTYLITLLLTLLFFLIESLYFRMANYFNIIDKPNHRSSHSNITIRGGGILFPLAILLYYPFAGQSIYSLFCLGLLLISMISFWDDVHPVSNKIRLSIHALAVSLLFYGFGFLNYPLWWMLLGYILVIGTINAYNFMDGINGITGLYSLSFLISIGWLNNSSYFVDAYLLVSLLASTLVFLFFNFRKKAKCFAGDVGSVSMAFIICFLLISLIKASHNLIYIGFLLVYGLDAITTIIFRLIRKENIFEAHRSHFYQFLVNEKKVSALLVSSVYAFVQLVINILLIREYKNTSENNLIPLIGITILFFGIFVWLRFLVEGRKTLCVARKGNI